MGLKKFVRSLIRNLENKNRKLSNLYLIISYKYNNNVHLMVIDAYISLDYIYFRKSSFLFLSCINASVCLLFL